MLGTKEHINILDYKAIFKRVLFCIVLVVFEHLELFLSFLLSPPTSISFVLCTMCYAHVLGSNFTFSLTQNFL